VPALPFRQGTQRGLKPLQPLAVVGDPLDRVAGLDEPIDVFVEPDAIVVGVQHVIRLHAGLHLCAQSGDRLGDEIDRQRVPVRPLSLAIRIELVERVRGNTGGHQGKHRPGEQVGQVEVTRVFRVGENQVAAEHRHRQTAQVVGLAQQHLPGPLAVVMTAGVVVVDFAGRVDHVDVRSSSSTGGAADKGTPIVDAYV
jgi:hypothetical protein